MENHVAFQGSDDGIDSDRHQRHQKQPVSRWARRRRKDLHRRADRTTAAITGGSPFLATVPAELKQMPSVDPSVTLCNGRYRLDE